MNFQKIKRIPKRVLNDLYIAKSLKNWREVLLNKLRGADFREIHFRNGLVLKSPPKIRLEMLFHEVWVEKMYSPKGYEIQRGDVVLDIGANIGVFSVFAATRAKDVQVFAYEPFPANLEWLTTNVTSNGLNNITVLGRAVASDNGPKTLYVSEAWVGHSLNHQDDSVGTFTIESVTLDAVVGDLEHCDLMKIDCEGSEYEVFYGASDPTLAKIERIVGEYHDIDHDRRNGRSLCSFLGKKGFNITHFKDFQDGTGSFCAVKSKGTTSNG